MKLLFTCEHATNEIPEEYKILLETYKPVLESHRGYDPGAYDLFKLLEPQATKSYWYPWTRLLIEPNRSLKHRQLFSEITNSLSKEEKQVLIEEYYLPYRQAVEQGVHDLMTEEEKVLHLSIHTFSPMLHGELRNADIGLLYDPKNIAEKEWCSQFKQRLFEVAPELRVRFNYPYLGTADGLTTYLRKRFPDNYLGIEIEVNSSSLHQVARQLSASLLS